MKSIGHGLFELTCKVILYSHNNDKSKDNHNAKVQNKMKLCYLTIKNSALMVVLAWHDV